MSFGGFDPEILADFLTESGELLEQLEGDLVDLESRSTDPELLNQVFRALHTIKGSASFLGLTNLVEIAHCSESALNAARAGNIVVGRPEMDLLLEAVDIIRSQMQVLNDGGEDLPKAPDQLVATLTAIGEGKGAPAATEDAPERGDRSPPHTQGGAPKPLVLGEGRDDLLDHLIDDVEATLQQCDEQIPLLDDDDGRSGAAMRLGDLAGELIRAIEFFEIEPMIRLSGLLRDACEGLGSADQDASEQLVPRVRALRHLLAQHELALRERIALETDTSVLAERIAALTAGETLAPEQRVEAGATGEALAALETCNSTDEQIAAAPDDLGIEALAAQAAAEQAAGAPPADQPPTPQPPAQAQAQVQAQVQAPANQAGPPAKGGKAAAPEQTIRVEVSRLEQLMNLVGELVLQKNRVGALSDDLQREQVDPDLAEHFEVTAGTLGRITTDIQVAVMRTRMQPLDKLFGKYPRLIRDLARKTGKKIDLVIEGGDTEVDKSILEELGDPLVHILRNSADHGIEMPEDRAAAGKDEKGTIRLRASHRGGHVAVEIIDDGKGRPRDIIERKAVERGLVGKEQAAAMSDEDIFRFIFEAGFSTAQAVSDLSGRGVGMDVVRTNVEKKLKGAIAISSTLGQGTTLTITIPLTIAIMPAMMVGVAGETYAVPLGTITEIVRPEGQQVSTIGESPVIRLRGTVLPLLSAQEVFDVAPSERGPEPFVVVLHVNDRAVGLTVSRVIGQQEIVITPLDGVEPTGPVSGATVRNDGGVSLIVDVGELLRRVKQRAALEQRQAEAADRQTDQSQSPQPTQSATTTDGALPRAA